MQVADKIEPYYFNDLAGSLYSNFNITVPYVFDYLISKFELKFNNFTCLRSKNLRVIALPTNIHLFSMISRNILLPPLVVILFS